MTFSRTAFNGVVVEAARLPTSRKLGDKELDNVKASFFFEKGQGREQKRRTDLHERRLLSLTIRVGESWEPKVREEKTERLRQETIATPSDRGTSKRINHQGVAPYVKTKAFEGEEN